MKKQKLLEIKLFQDWWKKPITKKDRILGMIIGFWGGCLFSLVLLFCIDKWLYEVSFVYAFPMAIALSINGYFHPKATMLLYPFVWG